MVCGMETQNTPNPMWGMPTRMSVYPTHCADDTAETRAGMNPASTQKSAATAQAHFIKKGWGFDVNQDFSRAATDIPVELAEKEYAGGPRWVIGYIAANPDTSLGFLKYGHNGKVRVRLDRAAVGTL